MKHTPKLLAAFLCATLALPLLADETPACSTEKEAPAARAECPERGKRNFCPTCGRPMRPNRGEMRTRMQKDGKDFGKKNLSPEQREKMKQKREQMKKARPEGKRNWENMTPEQREQMKQKRKEKWEKMTPEQRKQMKQKREQMRKQREEMRKNKPAAPKKEEPKEAAFDEA